MLARIHVYLNLHFLEVNRDKNCTDSVEHPRKQGSNHESKAKQSSKAIAVSGWVARGESVRLREGRVAGTFT